MSITSLLPDVTVNNWQLNMVDFLYWHVSNYFNDHDVEWSGIGLFNTGNTVERFTSFLKIISFYMTVGRDQAKVFVLLLAYKRQLLISACIKRLCSKVNFLLKRCSTENEITGSKQSMWNFIKSGKLLRRISEHIGWQSS